VLLFWDGCAPAQPEIRLAAYLEKVADNGEVGQFFSLICALGGLNGEKMQWVGLQRYVPPPRENGIQGILPGFRF